MKKTLYTDFIELNEIIEKMMQSPEFQKAIKKKNLYKFWEKAVNEKFREKSYPFGMTKNQTMIIACQNAIVAQELLFKKSEILNNLQPYLTSLNLKVKDLKFDSKCWQENR